MPALDTLTRAEKLQMMEALWDNLTQSDQTYASPAWHDQALQETERAHQAGEVEFIDWGRAKQLLREGKR